MAFATGIDGGEDLATLLRIRMIAGWRRKHLIRPTNRGTVCRPEWRQPSAVIYGRVRPAPDARLTS
ncbi:hypothetical protein KCP78_00685 [Salmonella enterica subsp. enterica]|nr:hypothetical protein KCP78_00685 [Salmonella enterica subsp. enterica]